MHACIDIYTDTWTHLPFSSQVVCCALTQRQELNYVETLSHIGAPDLHAYIHTKAYIHTYIYAYMPAYIRRYIDTFSFFFAGCLLRSYAASGTELRRGALFSWRVWFSYIHTCMHGCMHTCIHAYIHGCIHMSSFFFAGRLLHAHTASGTELRRGSLSPIGALFACMHAYIHACIHTYMYTYTDT